MPAVDALGGLPASWPYVSMLRGTARMVSGRRDRRETAVSLRLLPASGEDSLQHPKTVLIHASKVS